MAHYLESKPRYEVLDGLRGVAAIIVVLFHLFECYPGNLLSVYVSHGYLAVDFFFALSGFVMGYAYDDRWGKMSVTDFIKRRIIRLHPMVVFGAVVGVCLFYYTGGIELYNQVDSAVWWMVILQGLLMICMVPLRPSMDIRGWGELTSINGPIWTLMYEYVANILYLLVLRHLSKIALGILVLLSAILTADLTLHLNLYGLLLEGAANYSVAGGYALTTEQVYIGYTRLLCPFLMGLLLSRIGKKISVPGGFWTTSLMLILMLNMPVLGGENGIVDGAYQLVCILVLFPLILTMGAGSKLTGKRSLAFCRFLGNISYPLYITHYPLIYMQTSWKLRYPDAPVSTHIMVGVSTLIMAIFIAWAAYKLYDEPVREWLTKHWARKN